MLGIGAATIVVAPKMAFSAPEVAPVAPVVTAPAVVTGMQGGIRGLSYHIADSGTYFNIATKYPPLKSIDVKASSDALTRCTMENVKNKILQRRAELDRYDFQQC